MQHKNINMNWDYQKFSRHPVAAEKFKMRGRNNNLLYSYYRLDAELGTNTFTKFWINPVMIMIKNSIYSSHFELFCSNWVPRKLPIIPSNVYVIMLHILYVFNVIMEVGKIGIFLFFLFFVYLVLINNNTLLASFYKLTE